MPLLYNLSLLALLIAQFALPRRLAFLPMLIAVIHLPNLHIVGLGAYDFNATRLLIAAGLIRAAESGDLTSVPRHKLDALVALWSGIALLSSFAHQGAPSNPLVFRMGLVYNVIGVYLYTKAYVRNSESFILFVKCVVVVLVPFALLIAMEKMSGRNMYSILGGVREFAAIREGRVRAQGPFAHSILSGTAGASLLPLVCALWQTGHKWVFLGITACIVVVLASGSSGPILTVLAAAVAIGFWRYRLQLAWIRWGVVLGLLGLHMVMEAPVWYLLARIDVVGGSTGWHRAELITAGLRHLNEWWLAGTDVTRHWMPTGVSWSPDHSDITNHYLKMGVIGGLPLMFALIAILYRIFKLLGARMQAMRPDYDPREFVLWCAGSALFTHAITFLSVSYFDQINVLFWMTVGVMPGLCAQSTPEDNAL
jgi:uncharacterized membrane protein